MSAVLSQRVTTRRGSGGTPTGSNCPSPGDMPKSVPRVPSGDRHSSSTPDGALLRARRVSLGRRDGMAKADPGVGWSVGDRLPGHPCVPIRRTRPIAGLNQSASPLDSLLGGGTAHDLLGHGRLLGHRGLPRGARRTTFLVAGAFLAAGARRTTFLAGALATVALTGATVTDLPAAATAALSIG